MTAGTPIRLRLTLLYTALLVGMTGVLLIVSWWLLGRHLGRTLPAEYADAVANRLAAQYALAVAGAGLVALGAGWLVAGRALAPIRRITATARRVSDRRLGERIALDGPDDELRELAQTIDAMLDRLQEAVEGQRRFVSNASHELRTPLTIIRTEADVVLSDPRASVEELRAMGRVVIETTDRTEALLDGLLVLATSSGATRRDDPVDLAAVGRRVVAALGHAAEDAGVRLDAAIEPAHVRGDEALLERLVANLVENAIRHSAGRPALLRIGSEHGAAAVEVSNGGPRIAPELAARLAEPFQRLDRGAPRRGAGLGLSIVRAVAEAHGGSLALTAPATGGLRAAVTLPAIAAGAPRARLVTAA